MLAHVVRYLKDNPLMLLFVVAASGYLVGKLKVAGVGLGVAAVLFAGLAIGALDPELKLPELVYLFGLVLFVYTIGQSSGPGFFASFRKGALRDNAAVLAVLLLAAALSVVLSRALGLRSTFGAGLFAGATTNTPALASVLEALQSKAPAAQREAMLSEPVVAYSVTYPIGVLGSLFGVWLLAKLKARRKADEPPPSSTGLLPELGEKALESVTVRLTKRVTRDQAIELCRAHGHAVLLGRVKHGDDVSLLTTDMPLEVGDLVTLIGAGRHVAKAAPLLGERDDERLDLDRHVLDFRRIFVSRSEITEKPLSALGIPQRFGALVTRIRRGDVELLPDGETELLLGDRVRVVAPRTKMPEIAAFFGDSYKALAEIDVITFSLGIALGLLLGSIPIPIPGGSHVKLGFAGGPLVVGLVLGRLGRTGKVVWTLSYSANLTLRQLGLVLFLAGVGTRSGYAFVHTLGQGGGLAMLGAGAVVTTITVATTLYVGREWLKIPEDVLMGMLSGLQTQPAALAMASETSQSELPNVGYATVYPFATIAKIVLAQIALVIAQSGT
jgi:putative transport protein